MTAAPRLPFPDDDPPAVLPFAQPAAAGAGAGRIVNPTGAPPGLAGLFEQVARQHADRLRTVPAEDRERVRQGSTLPQFYEEWLAPRRAEQLPSGEVAASTLKKERQALRHYRRWDLAQAPDGWPDDAEWPGLPLGYLTGPYLERWLSDLRHVGQLSAGTVRPLWYQVRTVLNFAVQVKALDAAPRPDVARALAGDDAADDEDLVPTTFTRAELDAVCRALADEPELQAAWVLGATAGPRSVDLFGLRWQKNVRLAADPPELLYRAQKTGKRHWVPLPDCVAWRLRRLARAHLSPAAPEGLVFPALTSGRAADPEGSHKARRRNARIKQVLRGLGLAVDDKQSDYFRPWQVLRSTCSSRLNNHHSGAGRLVTHGKDADVNSRHYWDHRDLLQGAVLTLPQPAAFLERPQ